jgi:hypothetical protein
MTERRKPRLRDPVQLAKFVGDIATGQVHDREDDGKDPGLSELSRIGGTRGGMARAEKLAPEERAAIAKKADLSRWRR